MLNCLYHTEGLILDNRPAGESSRLFQIFTERLGRVTALAVGVRELKSKLRYSLSESGLMKISLVRGRGVWRIIYAEPIRFNLEGFKKVEPLKGDVGGSEKRAAAARLGRLLIRFVVAPGRRANVWRETASAYKFLLSEPLTVSELANFELLAAWRLLAALGYCEASAALVPFTARPWRRAMVLAFEPYRQLALPIVEQALYHSHL